MELRGVSRVVTKVTNVESRVSEIRVNFFIDFVGAIFLFITQNLDEFADLVHFKVILLLKITGKIVLQILKFYEKKITINQLRPL